MLLLTIIVVIASANADICLTESKHAQWRTNLEYIEQKVKDLELDLKDHASTCKLGWEQLNKHCYYFSNDERTWFEAERYCRAQNAFLAYIKDVTENNWIHSNLINMNGTDLLWIGATDCDTGIWIWSYDYVPLTYSNWNTGEPNNHRGQGENCCHIYDTGKWNDIMCSRKLKFVCKRHVNTHCDQH
ncbi:perlucin-like protein [Mytilus californianus]|uniref:perlucin-like protein n=1 Tax=Mytilus californianus TaxID=6549 RepID=UPI0022459135|nr:perlucin-like protein [Mytilus californianus]